MGIWSKKPESIAQLAQSRLDYPHIAAVFHIGQKLQRIFNDIRNSVLVKAAAFVLYQFLNSLLQFRVNRWFFGSKHAVRISVLRLKATGGLTLLTVVSSELLSQHS